MAAGKETVALDLTWEIHDGLDPGTFQAAGILTGATPPNPTSQEADASHFNAPGHLKKFLPAQIDPGDASFMFHWDPGSDEDVMIEALRGSRAVRQHRITFPTSDGVGFSWTFEAWIKSIGPRVQLGETLSREVTMRVMTIPTGAAAI